MVNVAYCLVWQDAQEENLCIPKTQWGAISLEFDSNFNFDADEATVVAYITGS